MKTYYFLLLLCNHNNPTQINTVQMEYLFTLRRLGANMLNECNNATLVVGRLEV